MRQLNDYPNIDKEYWNTITPKQEKDHFKKGIWCSEESTQTKNPVDGSLEQIGKDP